MSLGKEIAGSNQVDIVKVGVALWDHGRLLLVRKSAGSHFILPGGKPEAGESDAAALQREIREELSCTLRDGSLTWLGEFRDAAADLPEGTTVTVRLYEGELHGEPRPSAEVVELRWFDTGRDNREMVAPSLRNQILDALIEDACPSGHVRTL